MFKKWDSWTKVEIIILAVGTLVATAGGLLSISEITSLGLGFIVLDIAVVGLDGVATGRMKWGDFQYVSETYQAPAAISQGIMMMIAGIVIGAFLVAQALHQEQALFDALWSHPWFILLMVGGVLILRGVTGTFGALEWSRTAKSSLRGLFEGIASALLGILGIIILCLGALNLLAPTAFHWLINAVWQAFLGLLGITP